MMSARKNYFFKKIKDCLWNIYVFTVCAFSKIILHQLWRFARKNNLRIRPVILTCEEQFESKKNFIESFQKIKDNFERPVIFVDNFLEKEPSKEYLELLDKLNPEKIFYIKKYERSPDRYSNIQRFAISELFEKSLPYIKDAMLFLEDDVIFSSKFADVIKKIRFPKNTGFITLYSPYHEYLPLKGNGLLQKVDHKKFYGTQAVLFPKNVIERLKCNFENLSKVKPEYGHAPGYDHNWAYFLGGENYELFATNNSYVQHMQGSSRLRQNAIIHTSYKFIK
jgi:hypothetical protein